MKLTEIYWQLKADLTILENELEKAIETDQTLLLQSSSHLLKAGGKRLRPVFVLLGGKLGNYDIHKLKHIAVPLELIHMATLVHDDVIDDADTRRGKKTVKAEWDNRIAMYTGDYIFAKSLLMATQLNHPEVHQILSKAIVEMCKGEINQIKDFNRWNQGLKDYLRRIKRKTALLIAISCKLGALVAEADPKWVRNMYLYGYHVGMAFQITDDVLDFVGTEKQLGKPAGSDLKQGNITLPALYAYWQTPENHPFRKWILSPAIEDHMADIIAFIKKAGGIEYSNQLAHRYLEKARKWVECVPDIKTRGSLIEITHFLGQRTF
ncbi:heptaprenyl diphosphate synthase component II [Microaerobacter geothermalis]|uniref:heptaprenyl diphosphate synthase component II n=1 Tax=Microaerobacter geothermalis TaxID=674972 RepID=UPI001F160548|nr:heptaprenyl diphosphate synthase component II [Microaerobacter geothermalis]MCF6095341.1 heptaprenyl diphosphate synthase component II [Microaerobacter geothermalis]